MNNLFIAAVASSLLTGALSGWYFTAEYKDSKWLAAVEQQKAEAATQLQMATERALAIERRNADLTEKLEQQHVEASQNLDVVLSTNRRLSRELGGLRDPGRRSSCGTAVPTAPTTSGQSENSSAAAELSDEATQFLLEFAREADSAAQYAMSCHGWIVEFNKLK